MRQQVAVAILAKTPGFTPAKTRLAHVIGATRAEVVHQHLVARSLQLAGELINAGITVFVAPAEATEQAHAWWQARAMETIATGDGHLGQRMQHVHATLLSRYSQCVLIGTDSPGLSAMGVESAINELDFHANVVGPSRDGGFYLFANQTKLPEACWLNPRWGTDAVLEVFAGCLMESDPTPPHYLASLSDLDSVEDLAQVLNDLAPEDKFRPMLQALLRK